MRVDNHKLAANTGQIDLQNARQNSNLNSHSESKYQSASQYNSQSSKPVPTIQLSRITDNQIDHLNKKQQFLFENDINQKLQGIILSSRIEGSGQKLQLGGNPILQSHKSSNQPHEDMLDTDQNNLNQEQQPPQPRQAFHQMMMPHQSHTHHQSLSETRSLKSFKTLHDQRLQRQLNRRHETSNQGSNGSQSRQRSNVREMFQSKEEVKLFESKFKGSLEKLDEFEKKWQDFKGHSQAGPNQFQHQSQSQSKLIVESDISMRLEQISRLNQSQDFSLIGLNESQQRINTKQIFEQSSSTMGSISQNYQTQIIQKRGELTKDLSGRMKQGVELKNTLDQINESPRESILQSPSSQQPEKIKNLQMQQQPSGKQTFQSNHRQQAIDKSDKAKQECKTLKIDLNEERSAAEARNIQLRSINPVKNEEQHQNNITQQKIEKSGPKTPSNNNQKKGAAISQSTTQIISFKSNSELGRNIPKDKQLPKDPVQSLSLQQIGQKDDLVERVIESIKVLNKREEEVKTTTQKPELSRTGNKSKHPVVTHSSQNTNTQSVTQPDQSNSQIQPSQVRRRTNTLTSGERPNLIVNNVGNKAAPQQQEQKQTILQQTQAKENSQPVHQQIAQLKKQVQQQQLKEKEREKDKAGSVSQQQDKDKGKDQSLGNLSGFIGNSFIKQAQEKEKNEAQSVQRVEIKHEKQDLNSSNDPYQYNLQQKAQSRVITHSNQGKKETGGLSQSSKDKVEQLRKAFTSNKDGQASRSTKNLQLIQQANQQSSQQSQQLQQQQPSTQQQQQQTNQQLPPSNTKTTSNLQLGHNFKATSISQNQSAISTPLASTNLKSQNVAIKSDKTTKRADISLVNENNPAHNLSLGHNGSSGSGNTQSNSIQIAQAGTPNKQSITNLKKSNQITPQSSKVNTTSPSQTNLNVIVTSTSSINSNQNSSQSLSIIKRSNQTAVSQVQGIQAKTKNRRQPTQTQADQTANSVTKIEKEVRDKKPISTQNPNSNKEKMERVEGQKIVIESKKPRTMLDDYFHGSPPELRTNSNNNSGKGSQNNSKQIGLSRLKNRSEAHSELEQDITECEREFLERPKQLNFQPIQEPSINWNPSPEKMMKERKLFPEKKVGNFMQMKKLNERPLPTKNKNNDSQIEIGTDEIKSSPKQYQQQQNNNKESSFINNESQSNIDSYLYGNSNTDRSKAVKDEYNHIKNSNQSNNNNTDSEQSDDQQNIIEMKLNDLLEETRRRMINYDNDQDSSSASDDQQNYQSEGNSKQSFTEQPQLLMNQSQQQNWNRNKPQQNNQQQPNRMPNNDFAQQQQQNKQQQNQQPYLYEPRGHQYSPIIYQQQNLPFQQYGGIIYPSQGGEQPMITIINPASLQYQQQYHSSYLPNQQPYAMYNQQMTQFGVPPPQQQFMHQQPPNMHIPQQYQTYAQHQIPIIQNPQQQLQPLPNDNKNAQKQALNNSSMIIGVESQFFYPGQNQQNANESSLLQEDEPLKTAPKQHSQVQSPPQNPIIYPHQQSQPVYMMAYPPHYQQYQQPLPNGVRQQQNDSFTGNHSIYNSALSHSDSNSHRGSPNTHRNQGNAESRSQNLLGSVGSNNGVADQDQ